MELAELRADAQKRLDHAQAEVKAANALIKAIDGYLKLEEQSTTKAEEERS